MILLSFDTEEFDVPREHGVDFPLDEAMKVSVYGTNRILDCLKNNGVKATFFCTSNFAENAPEVMRRIMDEGHEVAAHGCDHWQPQASDVSRSKEILERLTGRTIQGYRQPRMFPVSDTELERMGYVYNSSLNPAFIPGRYMHLSEPRTCFMTGKLLQIPASVTPWIRFPLFWLSCHNLPMWLYQLLVNRVLKHDGYFVTYFHPWEFYPLGEHPEFKMPFIIRNHSGKGMEERLDMLIRKLKEKGVEVYFEKENIYTFDGKGELLLTIMSSLAQEESRSISENVTWGQRKRFADGKVNLPYKQFLGYRKGADGFPEVVPEEAIVVHRIYTRFMEGLTPGAIAKELTADGIPTPSRKQRWQTSTVESILQNEKYKGAALLQKCFTVDFLTKKRKVNEGEVPQYYVEHSHEPIITPEEFDKVQTELVRRKQVSRQYSGKSIFSSRIICGDCGSYFGSKVWNSTSKYRRVIWQCNGKFKGEHKCETPHLDEETIKARFVAALNAVIDSKDNILEDCRLMQATLTDCTGIDTEIESLLEEIEVVTELTKRCIAENSQTAQNQEEYTARYNGFVERYEKAKAQLEQLRTTKAEREAQAEAIGAFMFEVQELDALTEFDEKLWLTIIDTITVHADGRMTFKFRGGKTLTSY